MIKYLSICVSDILGPEFVRYKGKAEDDLPARRDLVASGLIKGDT